MNGMIRRATTMHEKKSANKLIAIVQLKIFGKKIIHVIRTAPNEKMSIAPADKSLAILISRRCSFEIASVVTSIAVL